MATGMPCGQAAQQRFNPLTLWVATIHSTIKDRYRVRDWARCVCMDGYGLNRNGGKEGIDGGNWVIK